MNTNELKLWYLKNLDVFQGMSEEEHRKLHESMLMKNYEKKEYIYFSSDQMDMVYIVKKGNVELGYLDDSGRELAIDILGPGEFFGAVLGEGFVGGYARAVDKSLICSIDRVEFEEFMEKIPKLSVRVLKLMGFKIHILENKLQNLVFKDVKTRICELLLNLYNKSGDKNTGLIQIPLTHQDIANLVGSTRETASIYLSELKKEGVISYERKKIIVNSPLSLRKYLPELS